MKLDQFYDFFVFISISYLLAAPKNLTASEEFGAPKHSHIEFAKFQDV